jgi:putative oxidoreductase
MFNTLNGWSVKLRNRSLGLLLIRIGTGLVFLVHGYGKVGNLAGAEAMFVHFGLGAATGDLIAWLEVIGGLALILGVATRYFAAAFAVEMLVAYFLTGGFGTGYRPHELEIFLMLMSAGIALHGSGRYSLYPLECEHCGALYCKDPNCPGCRVK